MSRVYFHTPTACAELSGAERAWLGHLATAPAQQAWNLDILGYDNAKKILAMVAEVPDGAHGLNFLRTYLREAEQASVREDFSLCRRFVDALRTALRASGLDLVVHGVPLYSRDLELNTALVAGSDPVALAAKINAWCHLHCWVDGPDRAWMADVIELGLQTGLYRAGEGWEAPRAGDDGPGVVPLLLERDDEPVVLSYSVDDAFPNASIGDWMPPWPQGVERRWDALSETQQGERRIRQDEWYALDDDEQWATAMRGLEEQRPWARLAPETLRLVTFNLPLNVHDVMRADRADHLRDALAQAPGFREEAARHG